MAIITPEELVGQISASRQPLGQLRTIDNIDGGISTSGKIIGTKVGCKGEPGAAATIEIGTVSTVSPTTPASVVNVGTPTNAIFNFEIPRGADGGGGTWGSITGTLSDQTDLKNVLDNKIDKSLTAGLVKNDGTIDTTTYSTFSGNYSDLSGKPTIPTVNDKKITIQKNSTVIDYFTTNNSVNKTINITVPTDTNDLTNSAGFITASENNTITGELTFSTLPKSSITPTNNDHLTRKGYVDSQAIKQDLITAGLTDYSSSSTYSVGDYVSYNNLIYKCNTTISTPEVWDSTKWTNKTYLEYLADVVGLQGADTAPIGTIFEFPTNDPLKLPTGFLFCDGSAVSRTIYADLFAIIGTSFGAGDGTTTFNLPTKEGLFSVGIDTNDTDFDTIGKTGGSKELQEHEHLLNSASSNTATGFGDGYVAQSNSYSLNTNYMSATTGTGNSGNVPPFIVSNYIIKASKVSQNVDTGSIVDGFSSSTTDAYSCNYSNNNFAKKYICASETSRWTQTFTNWTTTPLKISTGITNDNEMFILDSVNKKITIGSGVSRVKITAQIAWQGASTSNEFDIQITKNGNAAYMLYNSAVQNTIQNLTIAPFVIDVQENDDIQLCMFGAVSSAEILSTNIFLDMVG